MDKIEWRKTEPGYRVTKKTQILEMPAQNFFTIKGVGDPNQEDFQRRIGALYPVSYAIKMSPKNNWAIPNYQPYTVYPLEGQWGLQEKYLQEKVMLKEHFAYQLMIKQPDFVTPEIAQLAMKRSAKKIPEDLLAQLQFETIEEGLVGQILHIGSYDEEQMSFDKLAVFLEEEGYQRIGKEHKEIYLSDPRRVAPEKRKTILRVCIAKK
ncbi:GyrI-like domain-containing protein [Candidatus Enterococcus courvalinii]|uniref:GyrI-like domain-containing protein n=1 Tax=Candidatus Enterococcus courvalinii TaxID=2815329 RepID=A0ABS3HZG0_9ENTE|nr:GyrI-like domain-containing protein [Enterococcus sp. MSG2901]MBO0481853.1 GyrI-like domain-containing protein [Enterococcus sp. MSG2901]